MLYKVLVTGHVVADGCSAVCKTVRLVEIAELFSASLTPEVDREAQFSPIVQAAIDPALKVCYLGAVSRAVATLVAERAHVMLACPAPVVGPVVLIGTAVLRLQVSCACRRAQTSHRCRYT